MAPTIVKVVLFVSVVGNFGAMAAEEVNSTEVSGLRFLLYTKRNSEIGEEQEIRADNFDSIVNSNFVKNKPVKILTHGYYVNYTTAFPQETKNAYLKLVQRYNVIVVDWVKVAQPTYQIAAARVRVVGAEIAKLINTLISNKYSKITHFHHVGHSLGAQVGAFISENLDGGRKLKRATALDTGGAGFEVTVPPSDRLDPTDADFVDFITTGCAPGCTGVTPDPPRGTADFYPNGGAQQPGCQIYSPYSGVCAHYRAHQFFAESITTKLGFKSYKCPSYELFEAGRKQNCAKIPVLMGEFVSTRSRGTYYLNTNAESPFAQGRV